MLKKHAFSIFRLTNSSFEKSKKSKNQHNGLNQLGTKKKSLNYF